MERVVLTSRLDIFFLGGGGGRERSERGEIIVRIFFPWQLERLCCSSACS